MKLYTVNLLDPSGQVLHAHTMSCETDEQAADVVRKMQLRSRVELRRDDELVALIHPDA